MGVPLSHPLLQPHPQRLADLVVSADERDHGEQELEEQDEDGVACAARLREVLGARLEVGQPREDDLLEQTGRADLRVVSRRRRDRGVPVPLKVADLRVVDEEPRGPPRPVLEGLPDGERAAKKSSKSLFGRPE